ncbi:NADH dehydrogenase subunit 2, mitochondrial [Tanacetum coccineum]
MMNIFESMKSYLDATWKQIEVLNDQLLEATLKYDVEKCVMMCCDFVNDNSFNEIKKFKRESFEVQEGDQLVLWIVDNGRFIAMNGDLKVQSDKGIEFKSAILQAHYEKLGIMQHFSIARTPQQNGTTKLNMNFFLKENKNVEYFHVFESLCYPTNDREDLGKMKPKATTEATNPLSTLPNFASVFHFNNRVIEFEKEVAELKRDDLLNTQVTALVDEHLDSRLIATRDEFMNYLSASITARITEQVKIQLP